jgi:hypothetical protein
MAHPDPLDTPKKAAIQQALSDARAAEAIALRLEDSYIRYIVLANAGGMAACLSFANGLLGNKASSAIALHSLIWPMWLFFAGLVAGALIVSLRRVQSTHMADKRAREALKIMKDAGHIVPNLPQVFSAIERKGLPALNFAINALGIISQFAFLFGAAWGLIKIGSGS